MNRMQKIVWGSAVILFGILLALKQMNVFEFDFFFDGWWTLFIIVPSVIGLFKKEGRINNVIGLIIGVVLLLACWGVFSVQFLWKLWLPLVLVAVGLSIVFSSRKKETEEEEFPKVNEIKKDKRDNSNGFAAFSGVDYYADGEPFHGGELTAVFGGVKYDLRTAVLDPVTVISASAIFGGVEILLPKNAVVKIKSSCIFGGVDNKRKKASQPKNSVEEEVFFESGNDAPIVYVNAFAMFGGVEVK